MIPVAEALQRVLRAVPRLPAEQVALANALGIDARPFVVAVMFGASASFATPIGYQTNTLVHAAGGYRFSDFLRIGLPMNIVGGIVTVLVVPLIWPLQG